MTRRLIAVMIGVAALWAGPAVAQEAVAASGRIELGLGVKWVWGFSFRDKDTAWPGQDEFTTSLVDFRMRGLISDQMSYDIELAASYNPDRNLGGFVGASNPGEIGTAGVRQAYITFLDPLPYTTVKIGTFIPPLGNYMARSVFELDLINYPLVNNASRMGLDLFAESNHPPDRDFSMWQQTGFWLRVSSPYFVSMDFGMFNGMMPNMNANEDLDLAKATSVAFTFSPQPAWALSVAGWFEEFQMAYPGLASGAKRNLTIWWLSGYYQDANFKLNADYAQGVIPRFQFDNYGEFTDLTFEAWQITAGYRLRPDLELLVRYDQIDPNTVDSVQVTQSRYDKSEWFTLGVNYLLSERLEIAVNYIIKREEGLDIKAGEPGRDPELPDYNPKYSAQNNDQLLVQIKVWQ